MVDRPVIAKKVAAVRDAIARIHAVLPADVHTFLHDRTAREVVILNMFVALQESLDLATHWVADEGWDVPQSYREVFTALAEHGVLDRALADRLASAAGLRNLVAHRYGVVDWRRVHASASSDLGDLEAFCSAIGRLSS